MRSLSTCSILGNHPTSINWEDSPHISQECRAVFTFTSMSRQSPAHTAVGASGRENYSATNPPNFTVKIALCILATVTIAAMTIRAVGALYYSLTLPEKWRLLAAGG